MRFLFQKDYLQMLLSYVSLHLFLLSVMVASESANCTMSSPLMEVADVNGVTGVVPCLLQRKGRTIFEYPFTDGGFDLRQQAYDRAFELRLEALESVFNFSYESVNTSDRLPLQEPPSPDVQNSGTSQNISSVGLSVPAFFIFGDSTVDSGNNNYLETLARADVPPYGRDFDTHMPTGRFSNGRISVDYLASFMDLPLVPPYLSQPDVSTMLQGSNIASAGAGILLSSGSDLGQHLSFVQQVQHLSDIQAQMILYLGEDGASELLSNSIYYISIGSNDYIHYYLRNVSGIRTLRSPIEFQDMLIKTLSAQIKHLTRGGLVKKIVSVGIGPLGCVPHFLWQENSQSGDCIQEINDMIKDYNTALRKRIIELNQEIKGVQVIFCDIYDALHDIVQQAASYGFVSAHTACCGAGRFGGWIMCLVPAMACQDADTYVWWDEYHPTQKANRLLAESIWSGMHKNICFPMNLQKLASL